MSLGSSAEVFGIETGFSTLNKPRVSGVGIEKPDESTTRSFSLLVQGAMMAWQIAH